jgi:hypothetical protein
MGMRQQLTKGASYALAPKLTFAARHPRKAGAAKAASWAMDRVSPKRRRRSTLRSTAKGIGAAAFAVPVGIWLGRKLWSDSAHREGEFGN